MAHAGVRNCAVLELPVVSSSSREGKDVMALLYFVYTSGNITVLFH